MEWAASMDWAFVIELAVLKVGLMFLVWREIRKTNAQLEKTRAQKAERNAQALAQAASEKMANEGSEPAKAA